MSIKKYHACLIIPRNKIRLNFKQQINAANRKEENINIPNNTTVAAEEKGKRGRGEEWGQMP